MADDSHVCSVNFLNKCLERFVKRSEQEAIGCVKRGLRPDKLLIKEEEKDAQQDEPAARGKNKGGKGKR